MRELFLLITLHFVPFPFWKGLPLGKSIYIKNRVHLHAYARKHETFSKMHPIDPFFVQIGTFIGF